tara:strand:+ start:2424 stop:3917 length:1494 start_codon:yes stop_codon:yes gene_type:complete
MHKIDKKYLTIEKLHEIVHKKHKIELSKDATKQILNCRSFLDKQSEINIPIYGVNTGFGSLCNESISKKNIQELQLNLVISHACGFGEEVPLHIVKLMLFLKIQSLSYGFSGIQLQTINRLIDFYNEDILPVVYQQGSLGASGDLAPLAHLSLPLLGLGEVYYNGQKLKSEQVLKKMAWKPIRLKSKEGLALLNGTQFMSAYALHTLFKGYKLSYLADLIGSVSLEAFDGRIEPFNELVQLIRPHSGQLKTSKNILEFLQGSDLIKQEKVNVQDPYSFRCIPQVHGATKDALEYAKKTIITEINSVTDNPNIFAKEGKIISAGNFHGQPLALVMDHMAIALSELGSISERRIYLLVSGQRGLPPYLIHNVGLNSGFMIPQYTAASIASQNKQLCTPASVDSIVSSNGQEDHVSMGANAATKLYRVAENIERILSIELMTSSQALSFRTKKSSDFIESFVNSFRQEVAVLYKDVVLHDEMMNSQQFIKNFSLKESLIY